MMHFTTMIFLIVMIVFAYAFWHRRTELEEKRMQHTAERPEVRQPEVERELRELRERVKVLERIATDSNTLGHQDTHRIAAEIDALRQQPTKLPD